MAPRRAWGRYWRATRPSRALGVLGVLRAQKETVGLNPGTLRRGSKREPRDNRPTLAAAGIDKKLSSRAQKFAAVPEDSFEAMLGTWRERVSRETERVTTNLLREGSRRADLTARIRNGRIAAHE